MSDAETLVKYVRYRDIPRYTFIPSPYSLEDAVTFLKRSQKTRKKGTDYVFGIVPHDAGHITGGIGVHSIRRIHSRVEIGYWMGKPFRNNGYMREAIELVLGFCFKQLKMNRVEAGTLLGNDASQALLESIGFVYEGTLRQHLKHRGRYKDCRMNAILRKEWRG
jgi:RimJ/RimL family protein N-acetyltransferase